MVTILLTILQICSAIRQAHTTQQSEMPVVQWLDKTNYDFGDMEQSVAQSVEFTWKNISKEPIVLQTVRTTCGCTAAQWTETPVAPGQTGTVRIEYDAYNKGAFRKKIRVFFDKQRLPDILWVSGVVN
jgi:hypothetical protein